MTKPSSKSRETRPMRQLTKLEKNLGIALVTTLFLLVNLFGLSALSRKKSALRLELVGLNGEKEESGIWLADREIWLPRRKWLDEKQPPGTDASVAQPAFFQELQKSARNHNLNIDEQGFGEVSSTAHYQSIAVRMRVSGSLEDVTRWVAGLQQPDLFQAITSFSLRSEKEPPKVSLELEIDRWYAPAKS